MVLAKDWDDAPVGHENNAYREERMYQHHEILFALTESFYWRYSLMLWRYEDCSADYPSHPH